jgi:hypothetical protein
MCVDFFMCRRSCNRDENEKFRGVSHTPRKIKLFFLLCARLSACKHTIFIAGKKNKRKVEERKKNFFHRAREDEKKKYFLPPFADNLDLFKNKVSHLHKSESPAEWQ